MIRTAFAMKLKAGNEAEYKKRHDEIWPELEKLLRDSGVEEYYIYLDKDSGNLFAFQKLADPNETATLTEKAIIWKWWEYMADIMETNADNSPVVVPLTEVYAAVKS